MPLDLIISHRLGEESIRLEDDAGRPHVVGRSRQATVIVPSFGIAPRHCAVFRHEASGAWLLQDGNTRGGTRLNGYAIEGSRRAYALSLGDVIELGDEHEPPRIEVADSVGNTKVTAGRSSLPPTVPVTVEFEDEAPDADEAGWQPDADEPPVAFAVERLSVRRPVKKRSRLERVVVALLIGLLICFAGGMVIGIFTLGSYLEARAGPATATLPDAVEVPAPLETDPPVSVQPTIEQVEQARPVEPGLPSLDLVPDPTARTRREAESQRPDPAGIAGVINGVTQDDPRRSTPAWAAVARARSSDRIGLRLQAYQQFIAVLGDDDPLAAGVARWLDDELDALWWLRLRALLDEEFALTDEALEVEASLRAAGSEVTPEAVGSMRDRLTEIRQRLETVRFAINETMKYGELDLVDPDDPVMLDRLRPGRDPQAYATWSRVVMDTTLREGRLPWDDR